MDVFEYALNQEHLAEKKYQELAAECNDKGLKTILTMLADEETKHIALIKRMQAGSTGIPETNLLPQAKVVFEKMQGQTNFDLNADHVEVLKKAQDLEKKNELFYAEQAKAHAGQPLEDIFKVLVEEEKKHYFLLDNIIEFMTKPAEWLENAEFNHLDQY